MSAAILADSEPLAGIPIWGLPHPAEAPAVEDEQCPVCTHSIHENHREVYPWDDPPMLLCFLMVEGRPCFTECGACRRVQR